MTTSFITLDVWQPNDIRVKVNQGEINSRFLQIKIIDKNKPFSLTDKTVIFYATKPDGNLIFNYCEIIDVQKGIINLAMTSQMSIVPGVMRDCEIDILDDELTKLKIKGLSIEIVRCTDFEAAVESTSEFTALDETLAEVKKVMDAYSEENIMKKIRSMDGEGSGLDADLLDGKHGKEYATAEQGKKADTAIQGIKGNGVNIPLDTNKIANITPDDIGAVPKTLRINNKPLSSDITLTSSDVGAAPSNHGTHIPTPQVADASVYLRNDNSWQTITPQDIGAATAKQGQKADSAIQGVKINGDKIYPNINQVLELETSDLGAVPITRTVNGKPLSENIEITVKDINAATSEQGNKADSAIQGVKLNGEVVQPDENNIVDILISEIEGATAEQGQKADTAIQGVKGNGSIITPNSENVVNITPHIIGAVPVTRTINRQPLADDVVLTYKDVGAAANKHVHNIDDFSAGILPVEKGGTNATTSEQALKNLGAATATQGEKADTALQGLNVSGAPIAPDKNQVVEINTSILGAVPIERTINRKSLSDDVEITTEDLGAVPVTRTINGKSLSDDVEITTEDLGAVPVTRTINGKSLASDLTLTLEDISGSDRILEIEKGGTNATTAEQALKNLGAATATQGEKADSAIQGIKVNGNLISPDENNIVSISNEGNVDVRQTLGDSQTAVLSQSASTELLAEKIHNHKADDLSNEYFKIIHTGAKSNVTDMVELPSRYQEMPPTIGMVSADSTNGSFYLQTNDGITYQKFQIQTSGTGYGFKMTVNPSNGKIYAISGQNVFTSYYDMPNDWQKQTTTSPHDVSSPVWYSCENDLFFLSAGSQNPTPSGLWKSTDSLNWELIPTMSNGWYCCKWLNGAYWACGQGVYKSEDAEIWEQVITQGQLGGSSKWAMNILYVDGKYIVMGDWGAKYLVSEDAETWDTITPVSPRPSSRFLMWDSKNNVFGAPSSGVYYTSKDLQNWTNMGSNGFYQSPSSFIISNGKVFIDCGQQYSNLISVHNEDSPFILPESNGGTGTNSISSLKSNLGVPNVLQSLGNSTTDVVSQNVIKNMIINDISASTSSEKVYSSSTVKQNFASLPHYHTSSDIIDDYRKTTLSDTTSAGKRFVLILNGYIYVFAGGRKVYKSPVSNYGTELSFSNIGTTSSSNASPCGIYYDDTNVYVTTEQQYSQMYVLNHSTGALSNRTINISNKWLYCGAYCSGLDLYIVSDHSYFWTSSDNINFTQQSSSQGFKYLCANNNLIVGIDNSYLKYSDDGTTFTIINSVGETNYSYSSVVYSHDKFVYTNGSNIWYSLDGITWDYLSNLGTSARLPFYTSYGKCQILENSHPSKYVKVAHYAYGVTTFYVFNCENNSWTSLNPIKEGVSQFDYIDNAKSNFALVNASSVYAGTTSYYTNIFTNNFSYKLPTIPSSSNTYMLKSVNGVLQWVKE